MPALPPGPGGEEWGYDYGTIYCWGTQQTVLRPAGSWKQAAPVFAKGDFCRDGERARYYLLLLFLPGHLLQHSRSQSHDTCVMQLTLFIQASLVPPCFQTTFCKSCLYFAGGSFGSRTVQKWEDLKHSLSPISHEIYPMSCRNTWYRTRVHLLHSRKQKPRKATNYCVKKKFVECSMLRWTWGLSKAEANFSYYCHWKIHCSSSLQPTPTPDAFGKLDVNC